MSIDLEMFDKVGERGKFSSTDRTNNHNFKEKKTNLRTILNP